MKLKPSALILPNAAGVKDKLVMDEEDTQDDAKLLKLHIVSLAQLDEELCRTFDTGESALLIVEDISYTLAAFKYENPIDLLIPSHIQTEIDKIRFVAGF